MARGNIVVRAATVEDLPELLALTDEIRAGAVGRSVGYAKVPLDTSPETVRARLSELLAAPDRTLIVAVDALAAKGGRPAGTRGPSAATVTAGRPGTSTAALDPAGPVVGMALLGEDAAGDLLGLRSTYLSYLVVTARYRRRGVGRALVAAAADWADRCGNEHVIVGVAPDLRDVHRFFARLGFVPLVSRRVASVATLRRSFGVGDTAMAAVRRGVRRARDGQSLQGRAPGAGSVARRSAAGARAMPGPRRAPSRRAS